MSRSAPGTPPRPGDANGPRAPEQRAAAHRPDACLGGSRRGHDRRSGRAAALDARVETMRAGGMSATAIRRALGLNEAEALAHGLASPEPGRPEPGRAIGARQGGSPSARRPASAGSTGPRMLDVVDAVARAGGLASKDLIGRGQTRPIARARHLAMHLLRELCPGASLPAIGFLMERDHTTVLYGCRRAETLLARDAAFLDLARRARRELAP